jgi:hypothetical protein
MTTMNDDEIPTPADLLDAPDAAHAEEANEVVAQIVAMLRADPGTTACARGSRAVLLTVKRRMEAREWHCGLSVTGPEILSVAARAEWVAR